MASVDADLAQLRQQVFGLNYHVCELHRVLEHRTVHVSKDLEHRIQRLEERDWDTCKQLIKVQGDTSRLESRLNERSSQSVTAASIESLQDSVKAIKQQLSQGIPKADLGIGDILHRVEKLEAATAAEERLLDKIVGQDTQARQAQLQKQITSLILAIKKNKTDTDQVLLELRTKFENLELTCKCIKAYMAFAEAKLDHKTNDRPKINSKKCARLA